VGGPCYAGTTVLNGDGSYTITAGGEDIWQNGDQFHYAYKLVHGDFDIVAHVANRQWAPGTQWGKAGLMARQSLSPSARYAGVQTHGENPGDADRFAARPTHGGNNNFETVTLAAGEHRDWMRLERVGSVFTGYFSLDGSTGSPRGRSTGEARLPTRFSWASKFARTTSASPPSSRSIKSRSPAAT
jgi:hypothetical protein